MNIKQYLKGLLIYVISVIVIMLLVQWFYPAHPIFLGMFLGLTLEFYYSYRKWIENK
jgi:hypothetical protein